MSCTSLPHLPHRCSLLASKSSWQWGQPIFTAKHRPSVNRTFIIQAKGASSGEKVYADENGRKQASTSTGKRAEAPQLWQRGQLPDSSSARSRAVSAWLIGRRKTFDRKKSGRRGTVAEERPDLVAQWDTQANGAHSPYNVTAGSPYKAAWRCGKKCEHCGMPHEGWRAAVVDRCKLQSTGCPFCSGLRVCFCQSLAAKRPDLMRQWDFKANIGLDPTALGCTSERRATWKCPKHGPWVTQIQVRTQEGGPGCPACAQEPGTQPAGKRGLLMTEHPQVYVQLHPTLNQHLGPPEKLTCGSTKKAIWICQDRRNRPQGCMHEHIWEARIDNRCSLRGPKGCPYCSRHRVCPCNSIERMHPESGLMQFWCFERNSDINPAETAPNSGKKVWWCHTCPETGEVHQWEAQVRHVVRACVKYGYLPCPKCSRRHGQQPLISRSSQKSTNGASVDQNVRECTALNAGSVQS